MERPRKNFGNKSGDKKPWGDKSRGDKPRFNKPRDDERPKTFKQPKPMIQTTTLWDFPSQHYGDEQQGDGEYAGVTPSFVIWNLLQRYTKPGDTVLDPMAGSGTTVDVCKDLDRKCLAFDLQSTRPEIQKADARRIPVAKDSVDFIFMDPPYSTHIKYSGDERCIGELDARGGGYYDSMEEVIASTYRALKDGGYIAVYIQDSFAKGKDFAPLGFELFLRMSALYDPVDIACVIRNNAKLKRNHWHTSAIEGNFFLRGFNYLFIFRKNVERNAQLLKHESASSLSFYFRQSAKARPEEVITPDKLATIIKEEQDDLDRKLILRSAPAKKKPADKREFTGKKDYRPGSKPDHGTDRKPATKHGSDKKDTRKDFKKDFKKESRSERPNDRPLRDGKPQHAPHNKSKAKR